MGPIISTKKWVCFLGEIKFTVPKNTLTENCDIVMYYKENHPKMDTFFIKMTLNWVQVLRLEPHTHTVPPT